MTECKVIMGDWNFETYVVDELKTINDKVDSLMTKVATIEGKSNESKWFLNAGISIITAILIVIIFHFLKI
jgi:hypothetical protein